VDPSLPLDGDCVWQESQAQSLGIEAQVDIDIVGAWLEEQGIAIRAELIGFLVPEHLIQHALDRCTGHGGVEDEDWENFLEAAYAIYERRPFLARDLALECEQNQNLAETMPIDLATKMEKGVAFSKSLGWWLRNRAGRWGQNYAIKRYSDNSGGSQWYVEKRE